MHLNGFFIAAALGTVMLGASPSVAKGHQHGQHSLNVAPGLAQIINSSPTRTPENKLRDQYRHPFETLSFFGIRPNMTVVEIWPGEGWYTEILAPYLADKGVYYAATSANKYGAATKAKLDSDAHAYGKARLVVFPAVEGSANVPDGSADLVLTFRNVHNWIMAGDETAAANFRELYRMLKPGGVLGVVDHRLPENGDTAREKTSGYLRESTIRRLAEQAGFRFDGSSEVNANPKDTKDYPGGVWTLPPRLRVPEAERAKYIAIGESDRMTLRFVKPR